METLTEERSLLMGKYVIGLDYGTLSARALLAEAETGRAIATAEFVYPHGVMTENLPQGWALQHPQDYLDALFEIIPRVMRKSGVTSADVIGLGLDCTACTAFPVDEQGKPLCFDPQWQNEPNAYAKLWKHHAAQQRANQITDIAEKRQEKWLDSYGGKVSGEWGLPKLWELLDEAPMLYQTMHTWVEAGDWLAWQLTGRETRNLCAASFKHFYRQGMGYPRPSFYEAIDPRMKALIADKYTAPVVPSWECAGKLTEKMASRLGLAAGIAVSASCVDAHAAVPAAGITEPGEMLAIIGTSTCVMTLARQERHVPGICGTARDAVIPGYYVYEAGQSCVGDLLGWFCDHCVPEEYERKAKDNGQTVHQYLTALAEKLKPGESGLLALDWWNGNRSILVDFDLSGLMLGMTLQTKPEEIYRALIEATAYGLRVIVENFRAHGVPVDKLFATGGISRKNAMAMQIYADVLGLPVYIVDAEQGAALGSAIYAAAAAGCYDSVQSAIRAMAAPVSRIYTPNSDHARAYDALYQEYKRLHDFFARDGVMKRLKNLKQKTPV